MNKTQTIKTSYAPKYNADTLTINKPTKQQVDTLKGILTLTYALDVMLDSVRGTIFEQKQVKRGINIFAEGLNSAQMQKYMKIYNDSENELFTNQAERFKNLFMRLANSLGDRDLQLLDIATGEIISDPKLFAEKLGVSQESAVHLNFINKRDKVRQLVQKIDPTDSILLETIASAISNYYFQKEKIAQ